jgi:hypothetical protein
LGDFGSVDRESGAFNVKGNIFDGHFATTHKEILANIGAPVIHPPDDFNVITTGGVKKHDVKANLGVCVQSSEKYSFTSLRFLSLYG